MSSLKDAVEAYVKSSLDNYKSSYVRAPKVIHDTILGSNLFYPYEIAILDIPLLQRLRRVNQVDVVPLVFPSGNHNRFEHTLGVAVISENLIKALFSRSKDLKELGLEHFKDKSEAFNYCLNHIRMAAIMHDCGHGPFSHMSEQVYRHFDDLKKEKKDNPKLNGASPHEMLSYLIVTSESFKRFFEKEIKPVYNVDLDLDIVGEIIVGYTGSLPQAFLVEIINGGFDADKLDYIQRDSHFTGIKMVLDMPRLFYTVETLLIEDKLRLSVDLSGIATLEQIVFNKMMLFSTVYHHHKVRAAECLFKSLIRELQEKGIQVNGRGFGSAADFLYLTDDDIYGLVNREGIGLASKLASDLKYRNLPKRSLVLSAKTVKGGADRLNDIMGLDDDLKKQVVLSEAISEKTKDYGDQVPAEEIWIDMPSPPNFKEAVKCPIRSVGEEKGYIRLRDVFPVDDWVRAFTENKWRGYIFTRSQYRETVYNASKDILKDAFGIEVNEFSKIMCKMEETIPNA